MDVGLAQVLLLRVHVGLVAVREGRVVVFVAVGGHEVSEVFALAVIVGHVHVVKWRSAYLPPLNGR